MAHYKNNIPVLFDIYDEAEHIREVRHVFDGCIDMGGLPDSYLGVTVVTSQKPSKERKDYSKTEWQQFLNDNYNNGIKDAGRTFHEIYEHRTPSALEFRIDYKHGWLYLNPTIYNDQYIILDYYSRGIELTPASRIYTFDANGCVDLEKTLQTYIDEVNGGCKFTEANVPSSVDAFENIKSGESFSTMFGKIARWFTELKAHLKGTKWRHKAEHVDCKDNKTVQAKIDELEQSDEALQSSIAHEANTRANADTALGGRIDTEVAERKSADTDLENNKADRGVVTRDTIDSLTAAGIYDCQAGLSIKYKDVLSTSGQTQSANIYQLVVSHGVDKSYSPPRVWNKQFAIGSTTDSRGMFCRQAPFVNSDETVPNWNDWRRIDEDIVKTIGALTDLTTTDKSNLVAAINSLQANKAAKGFVTAQTMDTMFESGVYYVDNGGTPLTSTDAGPKVLLVLNSKTSDDNGMCYQIYFCTGNENDPNIICYRFWDGKKWSKFEEFGFGGLKNYAAKGNISDDEMDTLFEPGIYTIDPTSVIYVGQSDPHNDAEPYVLLVAKRPDNVTYQIAFCWGCQSSDGTMDNDEGDYDCILWRSYGLDKQWHNWRQLTSGGSGNNNYAAKGPVTQDNINTLTETGIYYPEAPEPDGITADDTVEMLIVSQYKLRPVYQMALVYSDNYGYRIFVRSSSSNSWTAWKDVHEQGTLKNPITVSNVQLAKTWKPGWYNCATIVLPGESGKAQSPNHLIRVTNQWDNEGGNWIVQTAYDWNGNASFYRRSVEGDHNYDKTLENHPFSATDDDWISIVDDKDDPFVMHGTYDLTEHPGGIRCMGEAASDNESWMLDYEIPPVIITNSVLGVVELKAQDEVYNGLTWDDKGKTFSVFAEYRRDDNYAEAKILLDEHPICQKSYAVLRSAKELSFIRLYLGTATVKDISIGGPASPDGAMTPSSADIDFTFSDQGAEGHNPVIYILNYGCMFDDKGGFNAGEQSEASDGGGAIGRLAKTTSGGAVGSEAESKNGFAGGYHAKVGGMGAAIGANASAYHGGAVGSGAQAGDGFAGGINAKCGKAPNGADVDCIQLGTGTNGNEKTLKVYDYQLLDKDGYIPSERIKQVAYSTAMLAGEIDELNYPVFDTTSGQYNIKFKVPAITVNDSVFGEFNLPAQEGIEFNGQIQQLNIYYEEYYYAKYLINNSSNKGQIGLNCGEVTAVTKTSGQPVSYIELRDGNTLSAVYIYLGYARWKGESLGPGGEASPYEGLCDRNTNIQIPLLHYSVASESSSTAEINALKAEIQELKANFIKNGDKVVIDANGDE